MKRIKYVINAINPQGELVFEAVNWSFSDNSVIFTLPTDKNISAVKVAWQYEDEEEDGNDGND